MLTPNVPTKSSRSGPVGNCVEVELSADAVFVTDTKDDARSFRHVYTLPEWQAFIDGVKNGEFDLPPSHTIVRPKHMTPKVVDGSVVNVVATL